MCDSSPVLETLAAVAMRKIFFVFFFFFAHTNGESSLALYARLDFKLYYVAENLRCAVFVSD